VAKFCARSNDGDATSNERLSDREFLFIFAVILIPFVRRKPEENLHRKDEVESHRVAAAALAASRAPALMSKCARLLPKSVDINIFCTGCLFAVAAELNSDGKSFENDEGRDPEEAITVKVIASTLSLPPAPGKLGFMPVSEIHSVNSQDVIDTRACSEKCTAP